MSDRLARWQSYHDAMYHHADAIDAHLYHMRRVQSLSFYDMKEYPIDKLKDLRTLVAGLLVNFDDTIAAIEKNNVPAA